VQGEWFANEELRKVYSSAKITLCDHWEDMRLNGFASNRLYDAVACGSIVVCDAVDGVEEKFGGSVVTFGDADELRSIIRRLLQSEDERQRRADGARERVMRAHTFDHRAADLVALVETHLPASAHRRRIAAL
jgi:spore maturation protein CgeB